MLHVITESFISNATTVTPSVSQPPLSGDKTNRFHQGAIDTGMEPELGKVKLLSRGSGDNKIPQKLYIA